MKHDIQTTNEIPEAVEAIKRRFTCSEFEELIMNMHALVDDEEQERMVDIINKMGAATVDALVDMYGMNRHTLIAMGLNAVVTLNLFLINLAGNVDNILADTLTKLDELLSEMEE